MLPNFIIIGAPKAGTTSLHQYLSEHPQVFMSTPKEVNYFSREEIEAQKLYYNSFKVADIDEYKSLFKDGKGKKAIGEASVSYLFYPKTAGKIKSVIPDVKIIILLRNPVDRGFSHYLMDYRLGFVDFPFDEIVHKSSNHKNIELYYQQYVSLGLYTEQVNRYIELFGHKQVKVYLTEELKNDSDSLAKDLFSFLDIDSEFTPNFEREYNTFSMAKNSLVQRLYASRLVRSTSSLFMPAPLKGFLKNVLFENKEKPKLNPEIREELHELYKPDILELEVLINRDLSSWYE